MDRSAAVDSWRALGVGSEGWVLPDEARPWNQPGRDENKGGPRRPRCPSYSFLAPYQEREYVALQGRNLATLYVCHWRGERKEDICD
jgi:hypothetical protein